VLDRRTLHTFSAGRVGPREVSVLGGVQVAVDRPHQRGAVGAVVGVDRPGDRDGDRLGALAGHDPGRRRPQRLGQPARGARAGARGHDGELVAADPGHAVAAARLRGGARRELAQHAVAGGVAEAVVDLLERVDVGQQQREPGAVPGAPPPRPRRGGERVGQRLLEPAPVRQPGQRVLAGHGVLLALRGDQAALEELDGADHRDVGHAVAERALQQQLMRPRRGDQRRRRSGDLERGQRRGEPRREEVGDVEHRQHEHRRHVGDRAAGQPQRGHDQRLQQHHGHGVAVQADPVPGDRPAHAAHRVGHREPHQAPEQRGMRVRRPGQAAAGDRHPGAAQPQQPGHGAHQLALFHHPVSRRAGAALDRRLPHERRPPAADADRLGDAPPARLRDHDRQPQARREPPGTCCSVSFVSRVGDEYR
jgi:hypothetical protein